MKKNIYTLEAILLKLKCKFSEIMYANMKKDMYALKGCKNLTIEDMYDYIDVLERKISLLKLKYNKFCETELIYPSYIKKTSLEDFYKKELILSSCDVKFLEKIQKFL